MRFSLAIFFTVLFFPHVVLAQQNLDSYTPPPLFAEPKEPPPKTDDGVPTLPSLSKPAEDPAPEATKIKKEKPSVQFFDDQEEMPQPVKKAAPKPEPKPKTEQQAVKKPTSTKAKSEGVVKGLKTMPSNKKETVDSEITYEVLEPKQVTLIDRAQKEETEKKEVPKEFVEPKINPDIKLPELTTQKDGSRKMVIIYDDELSATLTDDQKYILDMTAVKTLRNNPYERLLIEAYASSRSNELASDRRLSLSRALDIRQYILENNIESSRVDVRALGSKTNAYPVDRVEFYLIP